MDTPGTLLKEEREKQNKSLEDIEKTLKIHLDYLKAIESDNYELLPPEVFLKAYLRLYAETLGLDGKYILKLYAEVIGNGVVAKPSTPVKESVESPVEKNISQMRKKTIQWSIVVSIVVILFAVLMKIEKQEPVMKPASAVQENDALESEMLRLEITASEITWVSVKIDGTKPREWLLRKGEEITLNATDAFVIKVGNAGGTRLTLNGRDLGVLGPQGKVVDIVLP